MDVMLESGLGVEMACVSGGGETVWVGVDGGMVAGMELDWDRAQRGVGSIADAELTSEAQKL
jgi:hypothetical protein